jgi:hypothetical protein
MPKYIEKYTKKEILAELGYLKSFWLKVKAHHDELQKLSGKEAMDYLSKLKDIWISKLTPFQQTEDFQAKELYEKSKRIYAKMTIFLEQYIDPVTVVEVNEIKLALKKIIDDILQSRKDAIAQDAAGKTQLKKYLKHVIDRLGIAARNQNPILTDKVKDVDKKLNLIITNNHLYA